MKDTETEAIAQQLRALLNKENRRVWMNAGQLRKHPVIDECFRMQFTGKVKVAAALRTLGSEYLSDTRIRNGTKEYLVNL